MRADQLINREIGWFSITDLLIAPILLLSIDYIWSGIKRISYSGLAILYRIIDIMRADFSGSPKIAITIFLPTIRDDLN
ncbi:MAG: hypothetical protein AB8Y72_01990 [Coxiella-like endosymbiont]